MLELPRRKGNKRRFRIILLGFVVFPFDQSLFHPDLTNDAIFQSYQPRRKYPLKYCDTVFLWKTCSFFNLFWFIINLRNTISFSRESSQARDWTRVSCITGRCFTIWATREAIWWQGLFIYLFYLCIGFIILCVSCKLWCGISFLPKWHC